MRSGFAANIACFLGDLPLEIAPWIGDIADRKHRVADDGHAGRDRFRPGALAEPGDAVGRIRIARAAKSVDDDRPVVPAGRPRALLADHRRGDERRGGACEHGPAVNVHGDPPPTDS
jgi:hypothetical protein